MRLVSLSLGVLALGAGACADLLGVGSLRDDAGTCDPAVEEEVVTAGVPSWKMVELTAFAAPCGTPSDLVGSQTVDTAFSPKHVYDTQLSLLVSAIAHPPPYDQEVANAILNGGYAASGCFTTSQIDETNGIIVAMNLIPSSAATQGVSFEQPDGTGSVMAPMGFNITAGLYLGGTLIYPLDSQLPKPAATYNYPKAYLAGYGHFILVWFIDQSRAPIHIGPGNYDFTVTLSDGANATFDVLHLSVK